MPNGTIARREIPTLLADSIYCLNKKAWFNEQIMLDWIKHILAPYDATAPPGIIPIIFLDQFRVHKMGSIVNAIQALGMQVEFIPAGCTRLIQPVNVEFNEPFKCKMHDKFLNWMMLQDPNLPIPGSVAFPILGRGSYDVNHCIYQVSNNAPMITPQLGSPPMVHGRTTQHSR
jgi:hypothetical protein